VAASKPPLKHRLEQRITASDSTESLIRFCKKIDRDTGNSGKINRRNSQNYPATSDNSGFFTDDSLTASNSEKLTSRRDNPTTDSARTSDRITLGQWLFHGATPSIDAPRDAFWRIFSGQSRRAQQVSPRLDLADADSGGFAYFGSIPARSLLSSLSFRLQIEPDRNRTH
jgi:hypothetical protein